jgi:hypothetical protein
MMQSIYLLDILAQLQWQKWSCKARNVNHLENPLIAIYQRLLNNENSKEVLIDIISAPQMPLKVVPSKL